MWKKTKKCGNVPFGCEFLIKKGFMMYTKKCYSLFIVIMALVLLVPACKKNEKKTKPHVESKISKDIESRKKLGLPMGKEDGIASFFDEDAGEFVLDDNIPNEVEVDQYQSIIDLDGKQGLDDNENEIMWQEAPQGEFKPVYFEFDCRDPREEQKAVLCENIEKAKKFAEEGKYGMSDS